MKSMPIGNMRSSYLRYIANAEASVYFDTQEMTHVGFSADVPIEYRLADSFDVPIGGGISACAELLLPSAGGYRLTFAAGGKPTEVCLSYEENVLTYIMPGVGVLWDHGAVYPLYLTKDKSHTLWVVTDERDASDATAVIRGVDWGEDVSVYADSERISADWYPKLAREWFWHSAELGSAHTYRFDLPAARSDIRFTVYGRCVAILSEPKYNLDFAALSVSVCDGKCDIDARIEVLVGNERVALYDRLSGEAAPIYLPHGRYRVKASHGAFWSDAEAVVDLTGDACVTLLLCERVRLPDGWVLGELHTHSALEDATLFPRHVMRAARACGRNFCFMTDKDVGLLDRFGLHDCDADGRFLALPGQEIMCHELHTNVLNPSHRIDNPEAEDLTAVNPDAEEKISGWLSEYREMKRERPCVIMHNHPTHRPEVAMHGQPYFRSWWVLDLFGDDYRLVENCGYEGWFDRLNRNRRLFAAWTGDGHDCTLMYPGKEGVCVYVGDTLSAESIIGALESGRFFSCRAPGAFIDIAHEGGNSVRVTVRAAHKIERLEIIADGKLAASHDGGVLMLDESFKLPQNVHWAIARVKLCGTEWDESTHSFTPFMAAGFDAFTNPIFFS